MFLGGILHGSELPHLPLQLILLVYCELPEVAHRQESISSRGSGLSLSPLQHDVSR